MGTRRPVVPPGNEGPLLPALFLDAACAHSACLLNELIFNQKVLPLIMSCAINIHLIRQIEPLGGSCRLPAPPLHEEFIASGSEHHYGQSVRHSL